MIVFGREKANKEAAQLEEATKKQIENHAADWKVRINRVFR